MNRKTQLFIRACKSENPLVRLESIYRRFYLTYTIAEGGEEAFKVDFYNDVTWILAGICTDYSLISTQRLAHSLNPENAWKYGAKGKGYSFHLLKLLISAIKFADPSKIEGFISPIKFRRNK